jgi:glycerol 3-phosphatase-2
VTARGQQLGSCDSPLATAYDVALLDLDGVVYRGTEPVEHAAAALTAARAAGMRLAFVTNNASRTPAAVAEVLSSVGVPADPGDVITSAHAAAATLAAALPDGGPVLVVGGEGLRRALTDAGFELVASADDKPLAVVQGYVPTTTYEDLAEATLAVRAGAVWIAANLDSTLPSPRGLLPGNGALVAAVRVATGATPLVAGKPEGLLHAESVRRSGAHRPLVVGDRLDTDIEAAVRGGSDSLLVLTGVCDLAELLTAPAGRRPAYVSPDLRGLVEPQPPVTVGLDPAAVAACGAVLASLAGDSVVLSGSGTPSAALRAACAVAWAGLDAGLAPATRLTGVVPTGL